MFLFVWLLCVTISFEMANAMEYNGIQLAVLECPDSALEGTGSIQIHEVKALSPYE